MKKIIVACGSGVATSQSVASKIMRMCEDEGLRVTVEAVDIKSIDTLISQCDIYVSITPNSKDWGIPTINGIPFLTGMGMDAEFEKLKGYLKN
ncbi:MAG: PTS sugar transporter subunit IIB [Tissierellales bacterium]|jgi:PTS system galactitol-specific IIB component|nr:PTS sugar transporter subunit IIB [Tissierellales bacterium]